MNIDRDPSLPTPALVLCKPAPSTTTPNTQHHPYLRRTTWNSQAQIFAEAGHLPDYETGIVARAEAARERRESSLFNRLRRAYIAFMQPPRIPGHSLRRSLHRA
jgi:hypothetical protein